MLRRPPICGSLRLRTTAQEYVLESDGDDSGTALRLQRSQTDEVIVTQLPPMSGYGELGESVPIVGVVGVVHLLSGPYILVVAGADLVGKVLGHDVYRVADVRILPFAADLSGLSAPQQQDEQLYLAMLRTFLTSRHLYFSYTMDLTSSLQEQSAWTPEHQRSPIWRTADSRFFWNEALVRPLTAISGGCDSFILPIVRRDLLRLISFALIVQQAWSLHRNCLRHIFSNNVIDLRRQLDHLLRRYRHCVSPRGLATSGSILGLTDSCFCFRVLH